MVLELTLDFFAARQKTFNRPDRPKHPTWLRPLLRISRPLYHASSSKASRLDRLLSPQAPAAGDAERALAETSVEAAAMVTAEARAMAAAMAAVNATVTAAKTAVAAAMATASDSWVEGICVIDAAVGAITALTTAVKAAAR